MSNPFRVEVYLPDEKTRSPGRIKISFMQPNIYFGFDYYDHFLSRNDKKHHDIFKRERAIEGFLDMIRTELRAAWELGSNEASED